MGPLGYIRNLFLRLSTTINIPIFNTKSTHSHARTDATLCSPSSRLLQERDKLANQTKIGLSIGDRVRPGDWWIPSRTIWNCQFVVWRKPPKASQEEIRLSLCPLFPARLLDLPAVRVHSPQSTLFTAEPAPMNRNHGRTVLGNFCEEIGMFAFYIRARSLSYSSPKVFWMAEAVFVARSKCE